MRLKDKVALVTGAGSGNGAAIAVEFLKQGARVVFSDINEASASAVASGSGYPEANRLAQHIDVSSRSSVQACVAGTLARFGRLDILVANAGINLRKDFLELTDEDYDLIMNVNSRGVFICGQEAARVMVSQGGGVIINISSIAAIRAPRSNLVAYGASKGAVQSMTRHMASDLSSRNIRVNAIAPGAILTGMSKARLSNPETSKQEAHKNMMGRIASPEEIAGAAVFLASDESSFMTGAEMVIDGGETVQ